MRSRPDLGVGEPISLRRRARSSKHLLGHEHAPCPRVVHHVARDIRELERDPEIAGPIECFVVPHAHDPRHHDTNHASDVVAVIENVLHPNIDPIRDIHLEALY